MIITAVILILIPIALIIASIKSKGPLRIIFLSLLTFIILIPVTLIILIKPAQKGKILPGWGRLSLLIFEPKDLWQPLAEAPLEKNEYNFKFSHNYVGNHDISIVFSDKNIDTWEIDKNDLKLILTFYDGTKMLLSKTTSYVGSFIGLRGNGLHYIRYSLPEELPVNKELIAKIEITGNIEKFINKYGDAKIVIRKGSDL